MAVILACDGGCGALSPDTDGLHTANQWTVLRTWTRVDPGGPERSNNDKMFCERCAARIDREVRRQVNRA